MQQPQIITFPQDVESELSSYGILEEHLTEIGWRGYAARNNATKNDPPSAAGNYAYFASVRAKRELLCREGWEKLDKHNLCFTVNLETKIAIVVSSGDYNTGIKEAKDGYPKTKNSKGERTKDYISDNCDIFGLEKKVQKIIFPVFQTFVFLYFYDFKKGEIRLEVSLPVGMDDDGHVSEWHKRIILTPIPFDAQPNPTRQTDLSSVDSQDFDIPVKRRKQ